MVWLAVVTGSSLYVSAAAGLLAVSGAGLPDTLVAVVTARIGSLAGAGPDQFGQIEAVEVGADGTVFVLDGGNHELRIFDRAGRHRRSVGRQGEGPGEFRSPVGLAWSPAGDLWVIDPKNQRATTYTVSGDLLETHALPSGFTLSPWPGRFDRLGRFYHYAESAEDDYAYNMVRYGPGLVAEATFKPPSPPRPGEFFEGRTARGSRVRTRVPFTPRLVWRISSTGEFWSLWSDELRIYRHTADRQRHEIVRQSIPRPEVAWEERAAALEALTRFREMGGRVEADKIPRTKPPVQTFVLDERDRIWVMLAPDGRGDQTTLEVFSATGAHLETVRVPAVLSSIPTPVVRDGWLVAVEHDALDIPIVVVVDVSGVGA